MREIAAAVLGCTLEDAHPLHPCVDVESSQTDVTITVHYGHNKTSKLFYSGDPGRPDFQLTLINTYGRVNGIETRLSSDGKVTEATLGLLGSSKSLVKNPHRDGDALRQMVAHVRDLLPILFAPPPPRNTQQNAAAPAGKRLALPPPEPQIMPDWKRAVAQALGLNPAATIVIRYDKEDGQSVITARDKMRSVSLHRISDDDVKLYESDAATGWGVASVYSGSRKEITQTFMAGRGRISARIHPDRVAHETAGSVLRAGKMIANALPLMKLVPMMG